MADEQIGDFVVVANYFGYRKMYEEVADIMWPGKWKKPPLNKPVCGYSGENLICQAISAYKTIFKLSMRNEWCQSCYFVRY